MAPDLLQNDHEETIVNLEAINKVDQKMETLEGDYFNKEDFECYEEMTDEIDANLETTKDKQVNFETSERNVEFREVLDKVDQCIETLQEDGFNQNDNRIYEEITDESDTNWKTTKDEEVHSEISKGGIENFETTDESDALNRNFLDLPDELILKVLSFLEPKDLITNGQVSKRVRKISFDSSLWQRVNLSEKIVKTELLEIILEKGCKSLDLSNFIIFGSFIMHQKSWLRDLYLSFCEENIVVLEEILESCCSLEKLEIAWWTITPKMAASISKNGKTLRELDMSDCEGNIEVFEEILASCCSLVKLGIAGFTITPKMAASICQNEKTLQKLNLSSSMCDQSSYLQIIKCCQELKEVDLSGCIPDDDNEEISDDCIQSITKLISPNIEMLDLSILEVMDNHVKILLSRCKKIKALHLGRGTLITDHSLTSIRENLNLTLEKLSLYYSDGISITGLLELKAMPRLKSVTIEAENEKDEDLLEHHLAPFKQRPDQYKMKILVFSIQYDFLIQKYQYQYSI